MSRFILASGSPRRKQLLAELGIRFEVIKPDIDEGVRPDESPANYVQRLSAEKALAVAHLITGSAFILAADTTVIHQDEILGKPQTPDEARQMLQRLRGDRHRVCTGMTVLVLHEGTPLQTITTMDCTEVVMRAYSEAEVQTWIDSGEAYDKAGGYAIQSMLFPCVERIDGSYNNVVGLPTETLQSVLARLGWQPSPQD
ncbi:MAG: Maf family protein [Phototrophicaceae bacterium]